MKDKRGRIDTYPTIYYVDLIVVNQYVILEEITKKYIYSDNMKIGKEMFDGCATTSTVTRLSDNKSCVLVKYNGPTKVKSVQKDIDFINTISHEAGHVVIDIYEFMHQNICPCSSEPVCYLLGWVTECIYKTLKNK